MDLLEALKRAKDAVTRDKHDTRNRHVMLANTERGTSLWASTGEVTTRYRLDDDSIAPGTSIVNLDQMADLIKLSHAVARVDHAKGRAQIQFAIEKGAKLANQGFESLPESQIKWPFEWPSNDVQTVCGEAICKLPDFVGDDPAAPAYHYVQCAPAGLCASDMCSACTVTTATPLDGLLPARMFKDWGRHKTAAFIAGDGYAHVSLDEGRELRFARYSPLGSAYPHIWDRLKPHEPTGAPYVVVPRKAFLDVLKEAKALPENGVIRLRHDASGLQLDNRIDGSWSMRQEAQCGAGEMAAPLLFDVHRIYRAVRAMSTPTLLVSAPTADAPLRIEGGPMVVAIWRMRESNPPELGGPV